MTLATNLMAEYWRQQQQQNDMPTYGLVFYASLNGTNPIMAETGQAINWTGSPSFDVINGIPCMRHIDKTFLMGETQCDMATATGWTFSAWINYGAGLGDTTWFFGPGTGNWGNMMVFYVEKDTWHTGFTPGGSNANVLSTIQPSDMAGWHHFLGMVGSDLKSGSFYLDGIQRASVEQTEAQYRSNYSLVRFCTDYDKVNRPKRGNYHMAACRIYNRVLSDSEIAALAHEFAPTT